jgi:hypothetical protein
MFAGETVVVLTAGTTSDPYSGETVEDWTTPSETTYTNVMVSQSSTTEPVQDARNQVFSDLTLHFQTFDVSITRGDRVRVRGDVCTVVGRPFEWRLGDLGGVEAKINFTEG